jgi:hypothetical protein
MAAFATFAAAEARAVSQVADHTWVNAHAERKVDGSIAVRFQRYMSAASAGAQQYGAWTETTDDAVD